MNVGIIMGMVAPYLKDNNLTVRDFDHLFSMLSIKEQYAVVGVLNDQKINLIDDEDSLNDEESTEELDDDEFEPLYESELFSDSDSVDLAPQKHEEHLLERSKIFLSNDTLVRMIKEGDAQAKQDLCIKNQKLVDKVVNKYLRFFANRMSFEDLEQVGMMGMLKAADMFDFNMGTEFSTYAMYWIRQAIVREIQDNGFTIRIPVHKMEEIMKVMKYDSIFAYESNYAKRVELISEETGMRIDNIEECITLYYQFIKSTSLDLPVGEDEESPLSDFVPIEGEKTVEDVEADRELREWIEELLLDLKERERYVICMRFGLYDGQPRTLEEIGQELGLTRERIRQIEEKALRKLRNPVRSRWLRDFLE